MMENLAVRRLLYGLLTIAIVVSAICTTTRVASANTPEVIVYNNSDRAAFVTFWERWYDIGDFRHEGGGCVLPHRSINHFLAKSPSGGTGDREVSIRAEVKKGAFVCGGREETVHDFNRIPLIGLNYWGPLKFTIQGTNGSYSFVRN